MGLKDETIADLKETTFEDVKTTLSVLAERHTGPVVAMAMAMVNEGSEDTNPFRSGVIRASELPPGKPPNPLWFGMYPGHVTLQIGETGAGKSSLLLNIAVHAALGEELWGFVFPSRLRVLYVDPENSGNYRDAAIEGGLCGTRLERIGKGRPDNLVFHDGRGVDLSNPAHMIDLKDLICKDLFQLVILDPIANLFNTDDENSNAEAARQGKALTALSRETGACILVAHHTGKNAGGNYGRGASARLAAADVGQVFRARGSDGESDDTYTGSTRQRTDLCRLQIVKDRPNYFGQSSRYLRMVGDDRFQVDTFENWKSGAKGDRPDKATQAEEEIMSLLQDDKERSRSEILESLKTEDFGQHAIDIALKNLTEGQSLIVETRGRNKHVYRVA